ncbi:uncharacterized protein VTP21DRAFT_5122 [Calcarisporiella thermophila]|uniref:uncharacterized protein n=1 Tax=Calcarisporiella thermophila TaxID=911321 RepID=UPI0037436DA4
MKQITISPINQQPYVERSYLTTDEINEAVERSKTAFLGWKKTPLAERIQIVERFIQILGSQKDEIAKELALQMGRPVKFGGGEINGTIERAAYMASIAEESLKDIEFMDTSKPSFKRFIRREPLGVVLIIAAWNYPYLVAVNGVIPALLAGNTVILKHSPHTPLCAERFLSCFQQAGLPDGVLQIFHITNEDTELLIQHPAVAHVNFTGSVATGQKVQRAASSKFMGVGLELGGKDPAYVLSDCDIDYTVEQLVDGSFFNSGQSCCAIERIYVHENVYNEFIEKFVALAKTYKLGDPLDPTTTLGPMVRTSIAENVREHIRDAVAKGAEALIDIEKLYPQDRPGTTYVAPQVLVNVNHNMKVMSEETFGPVVGIMKVSTDDEAIKLMNDSPYGLTASIWTRDEENALRIAEQLDTGTCFMNRCDYLDPCLAWVGVKNSGRGCTLSKLGYESLTRPKSYHFKIIS